MARLFTILFLLAMIRISSAQCYTCAGTYVSSPRPLCDSSKLNWANWTLVTSNLATGVISSDLSVSVTKSTNDLASTGVVFSGGVFPPSYGVPVNTTALLNNLAGVLRLCFNKPVINPQVCIASIGQGGIPVQINTSACYQVLWQGQQMTYLNDTSMVGREGYTIINFPGVHTCINLTFLQSEYYANVCVGIADTNCQKAAPAPFCASSGNAAMLIANGADSYTWSPTAGLNKDTGAMVMASPTATTTYYVTGTSANNCISTDSIIVRIKPAPSVRIAGDSLICVGNQTVLDAGAGYATYAWSSGSSNSSILVSQWGNYSVTVTNNDGCTGADAKDVDFIPPPVLTGIPDTSICDGQSVVLSAGASSSWSYSWTPSGGLSCNDCPLPLASPSVTTTYIVMVNSATGCEASDTVLVQVDSLPRPAAVTSKEFICASDSTQICAPSGYISYLWSNDETTSCFYVNQAGSYYVTVRDANGCLGESNHQLISVYPVPSVAIVINGDSISSFGAATYQWYLNGVKIEGATSSGYSTRESGYYRLEITDDNGCAAVSVPVLISGMEDLGSEVVSLYPNPATGANLQLTVAESLVGSNLEVYDANGRLVFFSKLMAQNSQMELPLSSGIYFLRIHSDQISVTRRWVRL